MAESYSKAEVKEKNTESLAIILGIAGRKIRIFWSPMLKKP
jgi:hypothetical protein